MNDIQLVLNCNKILVNPKNVWNELIHIGFIEDNFKHVTISRLVYDDEIYIEHNDQINYLYSHYQDVNFIIKDNFLIIDTIKQTSVCNMPNKIKIVLNQTVENLEEVLSALKAPTL